MEKSNVLTFEDMEKLVDFLPSGSGFDYSYEIDEKINTFHILSSYHCMSEHGYYDGWQDFKIILSKDRAKINDFKLQFCNGNARARKYLLKEYMDETIYESIQDYIKGYKEKTHI